LIKSSKLKNDPNLSSSQDSHVYILNYESDGSNNNIYLPERPSRSIAKESRSSNDKNQNDPLKENINKANLLKMDKIYSIEIEESEGENNSFISTKMPKRWKRLQLFKKPRIRNDGEQGKKKPSILYSRTILRKYSRHMIRY